MAEFPNYLKWISFHLQGITLKSYLGCNYWNCPGRRRLKKKNYLFGVIYSSFAFEYIYIYIYYFNVYEKKEGFFKQN